LTDGNVVAIVGGGPAGVSCAIALRHLAQVTQRDVRVVLYEAKTFRGRAPHYNQCAGVLSPPIVSVLESRLKVPFPFHLVQRSITQYVLHSDRQEINLDGEGEPSYALRRVQFDDYLLGKAWEAGVEVVNSRVIDLELHGSDVVVYSDSESRRVTAVIGGFGLDDGTCRIFERAVDYQQPKFLTSIVTKVHPKADFLARMGDTIHAFLPSLPEIEFGAVTPKGNHVTINIAGGAVDANAMDRFLALPAVRRLLPSIADRDLELGADDFHYFKGKFPVSLARGYYGDRFAIIGDAAGLIRPFKGKGVTAGCASGVSLAEAMFTRGVSGRAFRDFFCNDDYCREIKDDMPYARTLRWLASVIANRGFLDAIIALARRDAGLRRALYDSVSAHRPYRDIAREAFTPRLVARAAREVVASFGLGSKDGPTLPPQRRQKPATTGTPHQELDSFSDHQ
jgi:flavin-dependent dehydrogenase